MTKWELACRFFFSARLNENRTFHLFDRVNLTSIVIFSFFDENKNEFFLEIKFLSKVKFCKKVWITEKYSY